jgi:hypothetical protein
MWPLTINLGNLATLAREIGVSRQVVSRWLAGRQQPTGEQAAGVSEKTVTGER